MFIFILNVSLYFMCQIQKTFPYHVNSPYLSWNVSPHLCMGCLQRRLYIQTRKNYDHCALWFMLVSSDTIFIKIVPTGSNNIFNFTITCSSLSRRENYTAPPFRRYIFCSPEAYHRIQIALYYLAAFHFQFVTSSLLVFQSSSLILHNKFLFIQFAVSVFSMLIIFKKIELSIYSIAVSVFSILII